MIKFGVPFGDTLGDPCPSALKASWDLQNVSHTFLAEDERSKRLHQLDYTPTRAESTALSTSPACRITFGFSQPSRLFKITSAADLVPDNVKAEWAVSKTFGGSWYVGTTATTQINSKTGLFHNLLHQKDTGVKATVANRLWHMVFDNPTYLVYGATLGLVSRQPTYFFSWGAPYPWYWKPEFKPPKQVISKIEKKVAKMTVDAKKGLLDQNPDMSNVTEQVDEMYHSVFSDYWEPVRNLRAYHDSIDGPYLSIGETSVNGHFHPGSGAWTLAGSYNYDGRNKFAVQAEGTMTSKGVDVTLRYDRGGHALLRGPLSVQLSHNSSTAQTVVGFWRPLAAGLGLQASYNIGTKRIGVELCGGVLNGSIQRLSLDCPAFDAAKDIKASQGKDGSLQFSWETC